MEIQNSAGPEMLRGLGHVLAVHAQSAYPLLGILTPVFLCFTSNTLRALLPGKSRRSRYCHSLQSWEGSLLQGLLMVQLLNCHLNKVGRVLSALHLLSRLLPTVSVASGGIIRQNRYRNRSQQKSHSPPGQSVCAWEVWQTIIQRFMSC